MRLPGLWPILGWGIISNSFPPNIYPIKREIEVGWKGNKFKLRQNR